MNMPFATGFVVVSPFGMRTDPITGEANVWHGGVDLVGNDRSVRAVKGGTVIQSRIVTDPENRTSEWGNYVSVYGDDQRITYYCHLESRAVKKGDRVEAGDFLGVEGSTGRSTGIHLHFELRDELGNQLDPCAYLGIENRVGYIWEPSKPLEPWEEQCHDWSRDAVKWCIDKGILKGRGGDDYALGEYVTREELCVMLYRALA